MKKAIIGMGLLAILCVPALAQEFSRVEVFGGYQFQRINAGTLDSVSYIRPQITNGWNGAVTVNVNRFFGATADFSGAYGSSTLADFQDFGIKSKLSEHKFLFGPTFALRRSKITPFAHALFGVSNEKITFKYRGYAGPVPSVDIVKGNSFSMALGGGVDYRASKHFSLRLGQFDYVRTNHGFTSAYETPSDFVSKAQSNFRYSTGAVIHF